MKIVVHNYYDVLNYNDNMFSGVGDVTIKFFLDQMSSLKRLGEAERIVFGSSSIIKLDDADAVLFVDFPKSKDVFFKKAVESKKPLFLLVWESGIINPMNINVRAHDVFEKVFTYDDTVVDNIKYIKVPYSFNFPKKINKVFDDKLFCCLISGNKYSYHPNELYSERLKIIDWFELNSPNKFSLYGRGWDKVIPPRNFIDKLINRYDFFGCFKKNIFQTYQGEVIDKLDVLAKYKFSICFENAKDLTGYISEKIFDCFFSGCVPVYLGSNNVTDFIPKECFIDYRDFDTIDDLYLFLNTMEREKYLTYLDSIDDFLKNDSSFIFKNEYFSLSIIKNIRLVLSND